MKHPVAGTINAETNDVNNEGHSLRCMYTNADSLHNKLPELAAEITVRKPDIILITEVKPKKYKIQTSSKGNSPIRIPRTYPQSG